MITGLNTFEHALAAPTSPNKTESSLRAEIAPFRILIVTSGTGAWFKVITQMWGGKNFSFSTIPFKQLNLIKMNAAHKGLTDYRAGILSYDYLTITGSTYFFPPFKKSGIYCFIGFPLLTMFGKLLQKYNTATSKSLIPLL